MSRVNRGWLVLGLVWLTGCATYTPPEPRVGQSTHAKVRMQRLQLIAGHVSLDVRFERVALQTRLKEAVIARSSSAPCRFGWSADRATLVGGGPPTQNPEERDLVSGDELSTFFAGKADTRLEQGSRLDLLLVNDGREECISLPLTGSDSVWRRDDLWSLDLSIGGRGYPRPIGGLRADFDLRLALGAKLGDVRPYAGLGVGAAFCDKGFCPAEVVKPGTVDERETRPVSAMLPLFVGVDAMPWQLGYFAFGGSVEYEQLYTPLETYAGKRANWIQGLTLAPRLAITQPDPLAPGLSGGPRNGFIAMDLLFGVAHALSVGGDVGARIGGRLLFSMPLQ